MNKRLAMMAFIFSTALTGCGKFADKFSRIDNAYTRVHLNQTAANLETTTLSGGLMVYFIQDTAASGGGGRAFSFPNEASLRNAVVTVPNGSYRVFAYGWDGAALEGQVRCGRGDQGLIVNLNGVSATVGIDMSKPNCGFGAENDFGFAQGSNDPSNTNFDSLVLNLCVGSALPCTVASTSTFSIITEVLTGTKPQGAQFIESPATNLVSGCYSGSGGVAATNVRIPFGGQRFNPPFRVTVYGGGSCSGPASATYTFIEGLREIRNPASGSNFFLDLPASSSSAILKVFKNF